MSEVVVTPGESIAADTGYLRGHGTYVEDGELVSNIAGVVEKVNKLVSVRPLQARYIGEVGDVVVGRVREIGSKRWRVDVRGRQDAMLMLSSVNLSGGVQRRRTFEDQLNMRSLFKEDDLISAEVHSVFADGSLSLHARSLKYGKLENGEFISVAQGLVKRLKQHFVSLPCGVDVILGLNGYIWLTETLAAAGAGAGAGGADSLSKLSVGLDGAMLDMESTNEAAAEGLAEAIEKMKAVAAERSISGEARIRIARVRNAILLLSQYSIPIGPDTIMDVYNASIRHDIQPKDMQHPNNATPLCEDIVGRLKSRRGAAAE